MEIVLDVHQVVRDLLGAVLVESDDSAYSPRGRGWPHNRRMEIRPAGQDPGGRDSARDDHQQAGALLIPKLNAELSGIYPEAGATHFGLAPADVAAGNGAFLVAYRDDQPVGCGAVRLIGPADGRDQADVRRA